MKNLATCCVHCDVNSSLLSQRKKFCGREKIVVGQRQFFGHTSTKRKRVNDLRQTHSLTRLRFVLVLAAVYDKVALSNYIRRLTSFWVLAVRAVINGITTPCGQAAMVARYRFREMAGDDPRSTEASSAGV